MGIQSGSLSLCRYRLIGGKNRISLGELNSLLEAYKAGPIKLSGVQKEETQGWVRPLGIDKLSDALEGHWDMSHAQVAEGFLLRLRVERRKVPSQLLQHLYKQKFKEHEQASGKPPGPKLRKELKEQLKLELTGRALPQLAHVDAYWRDRDGELTLFATGKKLREIFEMLFHQTFGDALGMTLVRIDPPLMGLGHDAWVDTSIASEALGKLSLTTPVTFTESLYP